jgi:hypothetical protein
MQRQALTDGSGRWFDLDSAECFDEHTWWNGNNHISKATGSQWDHEKLYRTAGGRWILNQWSQWQGSSETWEEINDAEAAAWLVTNNHEPHEACEEQYNELRIQ